MQNGFLTESNNFIEKSLALDPEGFFARYLRAYLPNFERRNWMATKTILDEEYRINPMRFDILAETGKVNFMMKDYAAARICYDSALSMMNRFRMNILRHEYLRIGVTYKHTGDTAKARYYLDQYQTFVDEDQTIYKDLNQGSLLLQKGRKQEALGLVTTFADRHDYFVYMLLMIDVDPLFEGLYREKAFQNAVKKMNANFWRTHERLDERWRTSFEDL